jgi:hypothetical protein
MAREVWIHAHVPKCGGSTLNLVLRNNFRARFRARYDLPAAKRLDAAEVRALIREAPSICCFVSHSFTLDLPFADKDFRIRGIALVRDPVGRFLSHYFFHRHHTHIVPQARQLDLDDYITYALAEGNQPTYLSGQTLLLSGSGDAAGLSRIERVLREEAFLLFPMEQFDRVCVLLERMFPDLLGDCAYMRVRVSRKDQSATPKAMERIRSFAGHDEGLWRIAQRNLDDLLRQHFASDAAVEEAVEIFRRRCRRALPRLALYRAGRFVRRKMGF